MKKFIISFAALTLGVATLSPLTVVNAAVNSNIDSSSEAPSTFSNPQFPNALANQSQQSDVLNQTDVEKIDPYVKVLDKKFVLEVPQNIDVSEAALEQAQELIDSTNQIIQENDLFVDPETKTAVSTGMLTRSAGHNGIEFHWNYARVYISKGTLQTLGGGLTLGGIWIPHPVISKVAASLGFVVSLAPNGIWFDYNYAIGTLTGNYGWQ